VAAVDATGDVLSAVNAARSGEGCDALAPDADLEALAAEHSAAMSEAGSVDVALPDGTALVATGGDAAAVAQGWLADDTLLDCDLDTAGVAATDGYWTLLAA
jgi:hypothetical protein